MAERFDTSFGKLWESNDPGGHLPGSVANVSLSPVFGSVAFYVMELKAAGVIALAAVSTMVITQQPMGC